MSTTAQEQAEAMQQAEQQIEFDPETASLEDLRLMAEQEFAQNLTPEGSGREQPRNDRGQEVDEIVYRKVIDLGDGSGVQVFEGATPDELIEKLGNAQLNATRKIKELSRTQQPQQQPTGPKARTPEEEWILSQQLTTTPSKAIELEFERVVGMPMSSFRSKMARLEAFETASSEETAAQQFMANHPDYYPTPKNAKKIEKYVRTYGLDATKPESVEQAFNDLNESGLLEVRPVENQQQTQATQQQARIAPEPQQPARQTHTRVSSGISSRRSVAQRGTPEPTEEDLYSMPLDKLRTLAISEASNQ